MAKHFAIGADRGEGGRKSWAAKAEAAREQREAEDRERISEQQVAASGESMTDGERAAAQVAGEALEQAASRSDDQVLEQQASVLEARERAEAARKAALEAQAAAEEAARAAEIAMQQASAEAGVLTSAEPIGPVQSSAPGSSEDAQGVGVAADAGADAGADVDVATDVEDNPLVDLDNVPVRRRRSRKSIKRIKRRRLLKIVGIFVGVIAIIVGGVAFAINSSIARGRAAFEQTMQKAVEVKTNTVSYDGKTYELNENMVSVCFIGFDNRTTNTDGASVSGQSDTVLVIALDTDTGKATGILIPRDSMVAVDTYVSGSYVGQQTMQICLQYSYGDTPEQSSELVAGAASRVLEGMPIDYYFTLNIEGVGPINDSIGGVTLAPTQSVPSVGIVEGEETTLLGANAERYVQWRDTGDPNSSSKRAARQISYLQAFASEVLDTAKSNPALILDLYNTASEYTWTNLGVDEFSYLATTMLNAGVTSFDFVTLEGEWGTDGTYAQLTLDQDSVYRTVLATYYHEVCDAAATTS